jgi:hypothetical protein
MTQSIGQSLMSLAYMLPQLATIMLVYRLIFNELLHIVVEPVKPPEQSLEDAVLEAVKHYRSVYGAPASIEDIGVYVYARPAREIIDRTLTADRMAKLREAAEKLVAEGKLRKTDHAYDLLA